MEWVDGAPPEAREEVPIVARAFGRYAAALRTLPLHALFETIPRFHDLEHRVHQMNAAATADIARRAAEARADLDRCRRLLARAGTLPELRVWKRVPRTVVHNDATPANALVRPDASVVVVDLDTTMAGSILSDVGELLRAGTRPLRERDGVAAPALYPEHVAAIVRGWLDGWDAPLHTAEEEALPLAGVMLTLENAVRFLTDHLAGDVYFRVVTPGQNLARHRTQLAHAQVQLDAFDDLRRAVRWALRSS
jgi:Ser/Thr protein kinase RdoA (MazF antagonist)